MKYIQHPIIVLVITTLIMLMSYNIATAQSPKSTQKIHAIKLDIATLYYTLFDIRKQIRFGFEYERKINNRNFIATYLDVGMYDKYVFTKYFDFFNQQQGFYSVSHNTMIKGFHVLPSFNHYLLQSKKNTNQGVFIAAIMDISYYRKKEKVFNSSTVEQQEMKGNQLKVGIGSSLGLKFPIYKNIYFEPKTSLFLKLFYLNNGTEIKSLNAHWNAENNRFWLVSNLKLVYNF